MNDDDINEVDTKRIGGEPEELGVKLAKLDWDIPPERDLWPEVSSKIRFADRGRSKRSTWPPLAMAASVVLAIGSLVFSTLSYQMANKNQRQQALMANYQQAQLQLIEQQHQMVRVQFVQLLNDKKDSLNPKFVKEAEMLMLTIDTASAEIKKAMSVQPNDPDYASMLVRTYQREINLLNQVTTQPAAKTNGISI
jgi:hypothetical protein